MGIQCASLSSAACLRQSTTRMFRGSRWCGHAANPPFNLLSWCEHRHYLEGGAPKPPLSLRGPGSALSAVGQPLPPPPCGGAKVPLEPRIGPKAALGTSPNGRVPDCGNWGLPDGFTPYPWSPRDIRTPGARYFLCCPRAGYRSIPPRQHPTEAWVVQCHPFYLAPCGHRGGDAAQFSAVALTLPA